MINHALDNFLIFNMSLITKQVLPAFLHSLQSYVIVLATRNGNILLFSF